jgi:hypothetical protein
MPREEGPVPFDRRFRRWLKTYRAPVAALVFAAGILLTVLASGDLTPLNTVGPFPTINGVTDHSSSGGVNYNLFFVVAGPIIVIVGAYLYGSYLVARRKFEHLMRTRSKAEFLRNLPEIEQLLWDLTPADERRYLDKRGEFRLR